MTRRNDCRGLEKEIDAIFALYDLVRCDVPSHLEKSAEVVSDGWLFFLKFTGELSDSYLDLFRFGGRWNGTLLVSGDPYRMAVGWSDNRESIPSSIEQALQQITRSPVFEVARYRAKVKRATVVGDARTTDLVTPFAIELDVLLQRYGLRADSALTVVLDER